MPSKVKATNEQLSEAYNSLHNVWKVAEQFGMCGQSVHERLAKLGVIKPINVFSDEEKQILLAEYEQAADAGRLDDLAKAMGRTKQFLARQAKHLGLTNRNRTKAYLSEKTSAAFKAWHEVNEHPRGMFGKKHAERAKAEMSKSQLKRWASMSEDDRADFVLKMMKAKHKKNGTLATDTRQKASWKAGWRIVGGQRIYFRSRWEANYGRYLQSLLDDGKIKSWEHEPITFWFEEIKRGSRSYLPDFRVTALDGTITYHEVKGWMDDRSRTKIARMAKYYPEIPLIVIDKKAYEDMRKYLSMVIPEWE